MQKGRFLITSLTILGLGLGLSACQSQQLSTIWQDDLKPEVKTPPVAKAPVVQRTARPQPPQLPSLEELLGALPSAESASPSEPEPLPTQIGTRAALLLPLSGPASGLGKGMLGAAQLALFQFAGPGFEIVIHDTKGTVSGADMAARTAIADGASVILGPLLAGSVHAVSDAARSSNIPVVAFSSDRTVSGNGIYTMGFYPGAEVTRVADYAMSQGVTTFGALLPDNAYGRAVLATMRPSVEGAGGVITSVEWYPPQTSDFANVVRRVANYDTRRQNLLQQRATLEGRADEVSQLALARLENLQTVGELPYQALLVAEGGKRLQALAAMLPYYDIDPAKVHILGTGQWDQPGLGAEPALLGAWYAAPQPKSRATFEADYTATFGHRPPRLSTLAYDATALAIVLGQSGSIEPGALTNASGFAGRDGLFRFHNDGTVERGLAVLEIGRQTAKVVEPAPSAFPNPAEFVVPN